MEQNLWTKGMPWYLQQMTICHQIPQTHMDRIAHMCFLSNRIFKYYIGIAEYNEFFANLVFLNGFLKRAMQRKEELADGRERNTDKEEMLDILERKVQQQENQIEELKKMYIELSERIEEDRNRPVQQEKYAVLFNNDSKLERMRYGIS